MTNEKFANGERVQIRWCGPRKFGRVICRVGWIMWAIEIEGQKKEDGSAIIEDCRADCLERA